MFQLTASISSAKKTIVDPLSTVLGRGVWILLESQSCRYDFFNRGLFIQEITDHAQVSISLPQNVCGDPEEGDCEKAAEGRD